MATYGWRKDSSLEEWLYTEGHAFEFFQAVKLLEILYPERIPVGEGSDPSKVVVKFLGKTDLGFPPNEIDEVAPPGIEDDSARMRVNIMSLAGALGPLPHSYTEVLLERLKFHDTALRDFLDIFNHRLLSLLYRVRKKMRLGFDFKAPGQDAFNSFFFSLSGLGSEGLRDRFQFPDRSLLLYTGLLALKPKSLAGFESMASHHFGVRIKGEQFQGRWYHLEDDQTTSIGIFGKNRTLGQDVVLGKRFWDQERSFRLVVGPLTFRQFENFLPINSGFKHLCEMARFYTGDEYDFDVQLKLNAPEVPASRLSSRLGPRLGWTSWLRTRFFKSDDDQVVLSPDHAPQTA